MAIDTPFFEQLSHSPSLCILRLHILQSIFSHNQIASSSSLMDLIRSALVTTTVITPVPLQFGHRSNHADFSLNFEINPRPRHSKQGTSFIMRPPLPPVGVLPSYRRFLPIIQQPLISSFFLAQLYHDFSLLSIFIIKISTIICLKESISKTRWSDRSKICIGMRVRPSKLRNQSLRRFMKKSKIWFASPFSSV